MWSCVEAEKWPADQQLRSCALFCAQTTVLGNVYARARNAKRIARTKIR